MHPVYQVYCVKESECILLSKNKDSATYDISRIREYNMRYKSVSKIKNLTCEYSYVKQAERELVKKSKIEIKEVKKEQKKYAQGDLF
jgi:hypothetical protein